MHTTIAARTSKIRFITNLRTSKDIRSASYSSQITAADQLILAARRNLSETALTTIALLFGLDHKQIDPERILPLSTKEVAVKKINLTAAALCAAMLWLGTAHAQRFIDNGDGTISDTKLGVMWEKKTGAVGGLARLNDPHNVNARYDWSTDASQPNGSAFENFLYSLNHETSADGQTISGCFANHCDWQVPSVDDLKSIVDKNAPGCAKGTGPCIDPIFGATASDNYWSYTTSRVLFYAYVVSYKDGGFEPISKAEFAHIRAVRNDPCLIPGFCTNP